MLYSLEGNRGCIDPVACYFLSAQCWPPVYGEVDTTSMLEDRHSLQAGIPCHEKLMFCTVTSHETSCCNHYVVCPWWSFVLYPLCFHNVQRAGC